MYSFGSFTRILGQRMATALVSPESDFAAGSDGDLITADGDHYVTDTGLRLAYQEMPITGHIATSDADLLATDTGEQITYFQP
jgi:hypothetical protein